MWKRHSSHIHFLLMPLTNTGARRKVTGGSGAQRDGTIKGSLWPGGSRAEAEPHEEATGLAQVLVGARCARAVGKKEVRMG